MANTGSPAATRSSFIFSNRVNGMYTSPRISISARHVVAAQPQRDVAQRAQVGGHVLADGAVAARGAVHEHAVLVREAHRRAVDLELGHVAGAARVVADEPRDALLPLGELRPR